MPALAHALANAHALVIGIADYQHARKLPTTRDAPDVHALLVDPAYCGYAPENVSLLEEGAATGPAIRAALANLAGRADAEGTVFFFFSGHGGRVASGVNQGEYLVPVEGDPSSDASIAATCISGAEFNQLFSAIPARKLIAVFDCCHAAGIGDAKDLGPEEGALTPGLSQAYFDALDAGQGRVIFASSKETEFSYVMPDDDYGLFTKHLLAGLRGGAKSEDGLIRVFDLFSYVQPKVSVENKRQHPYFIAKVGENFAIARYRGGELGTVARDGEGFEYDAFINFAGQPGPDHDWVWNTLVPRLKAAGVRAATQEDVMEPGVSRLITAPEGIDKCKRTIVVLSDTFLKDNWARYQADAAYIQGIMEGSYRVLPVIPRPLSVELPLMFQILTSLDLSDPARADTGFERLVKALKGALPLR